MGVDVSVDHCFAGAASSQPGLGLYPERAGESRCLHELFALVRHIAPGAPLLGGCLRQSVDFVIPVGVVVAQVGVPIDPVPLQWPVAGALKDAPQQLLVLDWVTLGSAPLVGCPGLHQPGHAVV